MIKKFLPLSIVIVLSLISVLPLFRSGFFVMHDFQQVIRLFEMNKTLLGGTFPVRWVEDLGFGFGYPLFNFYPPLVYYFGEIFHLSGFGFIDSIKIIWAIALIGSAVAMYFFAKEFFGKIGGLVSAAFYLYVPYHAVDAYVRGALAELFSFVWLPLILLFSYKAVKEGKLKHSIILGILLALLMLTHNLIFLPFAGLFTVWYAVMVLIYSRFMLIKSCILYLVSCILAFGLSALFWLPSLLEKQYTLVDQFLTTGLASYKIHFVCLGQLWNSTWGYGGSIPGCVDGLSFKIGKPHLFVSLVAVAIILYLWRKSKKMALLILSSFSLLLVSVFMTTEYSKFIWDNVQLLWYIQFPWRFLEFAALFSSFLAGAFVLVIPKIRWQIAPAIILISSVLYLHGKYFVPQTFLFDTNDTTELSEQRIKWTVSQTSFEYMPKGIAVKSTPRGSYTLDVNSFTTQKYFLISGDWQGTNSKFEGDHFQINGNSQNGAQIQFQVTNFPGWKVWVDDKETFVDDANKLKLITINVPPGSHQIQGRFTNTFVRTLGNIISLSVIIGLVSILIYERRRLKT